MVDLKLNRRIFKMDSLYIQNIQNWKKALDDNFLKYNVSLYQLKYVYEKELKNPSLFPDQECLKPCDFIFIHRYLYDSKEYKTEDLQNTFEDEYKGDADLMATNIISNIITHGQVRVGFFTRCNDDKPTYLVLSTHIEDEKYYTKCDEYMHDELDYMLYYMVRYNIDYDAAYMLSGMTRMDTVHMSKYGLADFSTCPYNENVLNDDKLRFYKTYFERIDLSNVFSEFRELPLIPNYSKENYEKTIKKYEEIDKICRKHDVSGPVYQYFEILNMINNH
jgi:hypothetical protein